MIYNMDSRSWFGSVNLFDKKINQDNKWDLSNRFARTFATAIWISYDNATTYTMDWTELNKAV